MPDVSLNVTDTAELAEILQFLSQWKNDQPRARTPGDTPGTMIPAGTSPLIPRLQDRPLKGARDIGDGEGEPEAVCSSRPGCGLMSRCSRPACGACAWPCCPAQRRRRRKRSIRT
jgi:hypothetical protein